ncbi:hypothetical protein ColKHC_11635 [Colletotrichum higginsianum]|nr:hypothetical protein ColKHC_11635 [Colletotrichum higginsianum]
MYNHFYWHRLVTHDGSIRTLRTAHRLVFSAILIEPAYQNPTAAAAREMKLLTTLSARHLVSSSVVSDSPSVLAPCAPAKSALFVDDMTVRVKGTMARLRAPAAAYGFHATLWWKRSYAE